MTVRVTADRLWPAVILLGHEMGTAMRQIAYRDTLPDAGTRLAQVNSHVGDPRIQTFV
jgi:hypothetical protein